MRHYCTLPSNYVGSLLLNAFVYPPLHLQRYFQSSPNAPTYLTIEWTNQHGCGGNEDDDAHKLNCNIVLQYMVMDDCDPGMKWLPHLYTSHFSPRIFGFENSRQVLVFVFNMWVVVLV